MHRNNHLLKSSFAYICYYYVNIDAIARVQIKVQTAEEASTTFQQLTKQTTFDAIGSIWLSETKSVKGT